MNVNRQIFFPQIRRHELHKSKNTGKMHLGRKQDQTTGEYTIKCEEDVLGPFQTSNFTCAESNANERNNRFFSFALDSAHIKFDLLHCEDVFAKVINNIELFLVK